MTITNDDLLKEISNQTLLELSDLDATRSINQKVIEDAIYDALSFIGSFLKLPKNPTLLLKKIGIKLTIIELKKRNGWHGDSLNEELEKLEALLLKMAQKKIPIELDHHGDTPSPNCKNRSFRHTKKEALSLKGMQWQN